MIDANSQFFAILTQVGEAKQANADALGRPWLITDMGVGDANGTDPVPDRLQTRLINEWRRRPLNQLKIDPVNPAVIIAEQIIPADEGGKWIREIGLYDADGDLVAVANCAPSFKPVLSQGSGRTQIVRMNLIVSSAGNITLKIDPAVVLATREFVEQRIMEELYKLDSKQSVRVATTANIVLAGLQTIDTVALVAGDRVLVKNQTVAKDNGLYIADAGVWKRSLDADTSAKVTSALLVSIEQGATLADSRWQLVTDGSIVLGTTALTFQDVTFGLAPLRSPAFLDNPTTPTAAQFDSSKLLASTDFVQRAIGSFAKSESIEGGNVTLTAAHIGARIEMSSGGTLTLPNANLLPKGSSILITTSLGAGVVNLAVQAGGVLALNNVSVVTPYSMSSGSDLLLVSDGSVWRGHASLECLRTSQLFAATFGITGIQKLPSGDIEMWGITGGAAAGVIAPVTFPMAFPNACTNIQMTYVDAGTQSPASRGGPVQVGNFTNTGFNYSHSGSSSGAAQHFWRAKGN
ncbi:phage tail protein [Pseudomonas batumici]|uniref:Phage tail fiber protein n=1 Tax=Pseudomonas batumici TaxID=226910 RepID=A0A0C2EE47_9PSED|nr:phage tail protein [Pseudomonas batumici]KIH84224.1 Phage tail fiber protein [Pseudomonas batumici]